MDAVIEIYSCGTLRKASWNILEGPSTRFADTWCLQNGISSENMLHFRDAYPRLHPRVDLLRAFNSGCWCLRSMYGWVDAHTTGWLSVLRTSDGFWFYLRDKMEINLPSGKKLQGMIYDMELSINRKAIWFGGGRAPPFIWLPEGQ